MFDASFMGEVVGVACASLFQARSCAVGGGRYDASPGAASDDFGGEVIDRQDLRDLSHCVTHGRGPR